MRLKGKFCKSAVRPAIVRSYSSVCWAVDRKTIQRMGVVQTKILWGMMSEVTIKDWMRIEVAKVWLR
ncbi:Hypothetical protein CINCED_3A004218 [Cinara cedri]|uniref:Uncharacterized protein n=1 Tax=Cinara cedri TaxID=506608 RepID=A0A5E4NMI7_9HEMI|nr:Hypothetical protein CINCED_3A004218 [Cinara cedri]